MIQELLGGNSSVGIIGGERSKLSTPSCGGGILDAHNSPSSSAAAAAESLRCPRCDSANTKFCYYNNYNLTQPRHFCKTCRRYWTKGGALRNVPIGGGCRKNKSATMSAAVGKCSAAGKLKTEMGRSGGLFSGFEHELPSNPILWPSSQNSHFLSLLRGNQNPNPNHLQTSLSVKDEGLLFGSSHFSSETSINARALGMDHLGPAQLQYRTQVPSLHGEIHNNGLQELYHRLRSSSSSSSCYPEHAPALILGNMASANSSAILESAPVATGELGFWNPTLSWPTDLPTTNGAYP